jgi:hypothetical protein
VFFSVCSSKRGSVCAHLPHTLNNHTPHAHTFAVCFFWLYYTEWILDDYPEMYVKNMEIGDGSIDSIFWGLRHQVRFFFINPPFLFSTDPSPPLHCKHTHIDTHYHTQTITHRLSHYTANTHTHYHTITRTLNPSGLSLLPLTFPPVRQTSSFFVFTSLLLAPPPFLVHRTLRSLLTQNN